MENQYVYDPPVPPDSAATEMSWSRQYPPVPSCQNTKQWLLSGGKSCWEHYEYLYETIHEGVKSPVIRPDERAVLAGVDFFLGPNEYQMPLGYDVGALVTFPGGVFAPVAVTKWANVYTPSGWPLANVEVIQKRGLDGTLVNQGRTADLWGLIMVLGVNPGHDTLVATGTTWRLPVDRGLDAFAWYFGSAHSSSGDTITMVLDSVQGQFPLVCDATLGTGSIDVRLSRVNAFSSPPTLRMLTDTGGVSLYAFASTDSIYTATVTDDPSSSGTFTISAMDDSSQQFFFDLHYSITSLDSLIRDAAAAGGDADIFFDSAMAAIERAIFSSTQYPVIRNGLPVGIMQVSRAHALSVFPEIPFTGTNQIRIRYESFDSQNPLIPRIYHWNNAQRRWQLQPGSVVDTFRAIVTAPISEPGVYAAFAFDIPNSVEPEGSLVPERFELFQNYPNPFNSATNIRFSLPIASHAKIEVFNILGQRVETVLDTYMPAGYHRVDFDAGRYASGVYFYRIQADQFKDVKKMVLLR
jgi:hypothetical protein